MRLAIALVLAACACSGGTRDRHQTIGAPAAAPTAVAPAHAPAPRRAEALPAGPSLYELALPLRAQDDQAIALDVDRGHPTLVSMFYGSCTMACPALIGYLKQVVATAPADTRVLLVSFDAARDTADHLRELAATHHLDARWTLASATPADARTLAAVLGVKYRATARGEFVHNAVIVALDGDGHPIARLTGLGDNTAFDDVLATAR
jgi:protein SCO1/2